MGVTDAILSKLDPIQLGWFLFAVTAIAVLRLLWTGSLVTGRQLERELATKDAVIADLRADNAEWKGAFRDTAARAGALAEQQGQLVGQIVPVAASVVTALPDIPTPRRESP